MNTAVAPASPMTEAEFLAMPDDGVRRWLVRGQIWEMGATICDRSHGIAAGRITSHLWSWARMQPAPQGCVACGEVGFVLARGPDTVVGADVAYVSPAMAAADPTETDLFAGPPVLAVDILSPADLQASAASVREYLNHGIAVVWVIDPAFRTVGVHRPGVPVETFDETQTLPGGAELPGFAVPVADVFA